MTNGHDAAAARIGEKLIAILWPIRCKFRGKETSKRVRRAIDASSSVIEQHRAARADIEFTERIDRKSGERTVSRSFDRFGIILVLFFTSISES